MGTIRRTIVFCCLFAVTVGAVQAQQSKDIPVRAAGMAAACSACHGTPERPPLGGAPSLAGQQKEFLVLQMFLLREGLRDVPQMAGLLKRLSDRDLEDVAAYFSRQPVLPRSPGRDPQLHARGAGMARAMGCGSCHLPDFRGQRQVPRIANQREDYLSAAMKAYRDNKRTGLDTTTGSDANMNGVLSKVTDSDIQALAHYLAHL
jgi:cytochrome c553